VGRVQAGYIKEVSVFLEPRNTILKCSFIVFVFAIVHYYPKLKYLYIYILSPWNMSFRPHPGPSGI
jgi:hypothetical protein